MTPVFYYVVMKAQPRRVYSNISQAFVLRTVYNGDKKFRLYGIQINEFVPYRFTFIVAILLFFAFIDGVYLFYTSRIWHTRT